MKNTVFTVLFFLFASCQKGEEFSKATIVSSTAQVSGGFYALVKNIGLNIIVPSYKRLEKNVFWLKKEVEAQCSDKRTGNFDRKNLKKLFLNAIRSYHFTEAFAIGIVAENGYGLQERIYPWPQSNNFLIDANVAENKNYKVQASAMGFPALEYLIYEDEFNNICKNCGIPLMENWNRLPRFQKIQSRCNYMKFVMESLEKDILAINRAWHPPQDDLTQSYTYHKNFKTAKNFAIELAHGLNFLDKIVKDLRLGVPAGINQDCHWESCPGQSEHLLSQDSISSILHSTKGFLAIFTGDPVDENFVPKDSGYGYEEWLAENGHENLARKLKINLINLIKNLERQAHSIQFLATDISSDDCKNTTSEKRTVEICALYQDIKKVTDLYKNDFLLATDFGMPKQHGGDTD